MRLTFKCFSLMQGVERSKEIAARLHSEIQSMKTSRRLEQEEEEVKRWWTEFHRERYTTLFGMVGTMAVFCGTSTNGNLFLPPDRRRRQKSPSARFVSMV